MTVMTSLAAVMLGVSSAGSASNSLISACRGRVIAGSVFAYRAVSGACMLCASASGAVEDFGIGFGSVVERNDDVLHP